MADIHLLGQMIINDSVPNPDATPQNLTGLPTKAMGQMNINESVSTEVLVGNPQPTVDVDMEEDFDEVEVKDNFEADGKKEGWSKCRSLQVVKSYHRLRVVKSMIS